MSVIIAYEEKMQNGDFLPNGMTEEIYNNWKEIVINERNPHQFHKEILINIFKQQNINFKEMTIDEAIETNKDFLYIFECHSHPLNWLGYTAIDRKEPFAFLSEKTLSAIRNHKCKVVFHAGTEGTDGYRIHEIVSAMALLCKKYDINPYNVFYISSNLKFLDQFNEAIKHYNYNRFITPFITPYFWEYSKYIFSLFKDNRQSMMNLEMFNRTKHTKKMRYLCMNRVPRGHRYLIAMELWSKYKNDGLLSMPDVDHDSLEYWSHWLTLTDDYTKYKDLEQNFKKSLPLVIDKEYNIYDKSGDVTWLLNSWPYTQTNFSIITESAIGDYEIFITEKTFKAIANFHPFILMGNPGSIKALKDMGFKTFHPVINENYDEIIDNKERLQFIMNELYRLCSMEQDEFLNQMRSLDKIVEYNHNHFWNEGNYSIDIIKRILDV